MDVFVTGLGAVSALGIGVEANFKALKSSKSFLSVENFSLKKKIRFIF